MNISAIFKKPDLGLLIIRLVLGVSYATHGILKFLGGTSTLEFLGSALSIFGIHAFPVFWGGIAALCEVLGGILIFLGYKFRFGAFAVFMVMAVALSWHLSNGDGFNKFAWALEMTAIFLGLVFIGPGKYSFDKN